MKHLIGTIPDEQGFIKKFRQHQGWWRRFVMNEEEGQYWDARNKVMKQVCNRINNGETTLKNFITDGIANEAKIALEKQRLRGSGIMETDRLYNNLLSSQPLALNFMGMFNADKELGLKFIQTMRPDIISLEEVVFEYAPTSSKDHSAFDFGFIVNSESGKGFIGFEAKYTDTFSYKRQRNENQKEDVFYGDSIDKNFKNYHNLYSVNRNRFKDDYYTYVRNPYKNQLFRNEILAMQLKTEFDFIVTGLFCHHDDGKTIEAGWEFQKSIGNGDNDFNVLTYKDYVERMQKLDLTWEQRETVIMLWARYCGLRLSDSILANS